MSWSGLSHQFLKTGTTYPARSLSAAGSGASYKFSRYGSYTDLGVEVAGKMASMGVGAGEGFTDWLTSAMAATGSNNYAVLTSPSSTLLFAISVYAASNGKKAVVWWGDSTTDTYSPSASSPIIISKTYTVAANRTIVIVGDLGTVNSNYGAAGGTAFGGDFFTMKTLTNLDCGGGTTVGGKVSDMPSAMTYLRLASTGALTGKFSELPRGLTTIDSPWGGCALTGDFSDLPTGLTYYNCGGASVVTGSLASLPRGLTGIYVGGANTVTGNLSSLPTGLTVFLCAGGKTISGNISSLPTGLTYFNCAGSNTLTGTLSALPSGIKQFNCTGNNTLTGNLSSIPSGCTDFWVTGSNTISGSFSSLPGSMKFFYLTGNNTITGNVAGGPSGLNYCFVGGSNSLSYNTTSGSRTWSGTMRAIGISSASMTSAMVDAFLNDLAPATWGGENWIILSGSCGARTAASNAAVATLAGKGVGTNTN